MQTTAGAKGLEKVVEKVQGGKGGGKEEEGEGGFGKKRKIDISHEKRKKEGEGFTLCLLDLLYLLLDTAPQQVPG